MIYIVDPRLSFVVTEENISFLDSFLEGFYRGISDSNLDKILINRIEDLNKLENNEMLNAIVIVFNSNNEYEDKVIEVIKDCSSKENYSIYPISFDKDLRIPSSPIESIQSFDIINEMRKRGLEIENIDVIGESFARQLIIKEMPSIYNKKIKCFLSHKRSDGENLTYYFKNNLNDKIEEGFVDLQEILAGEYAQDRIEEELPKQDLLILLQTPEASKSNWIIKEIKVALKEDIPIVWVIINGANPDDLDVKPCGVPHFILSNNDIENDKIKSEKVQEIINFGFSLVKTQKLQIINIIEEYKKSLAQIGFKCSLLEKKNSIYNFVKKIENGYYNHRDTSYLVKVLGRSIEKEDISHFNDFLDSNGYITKIGNHFDTSIILSPKIIEPNQQGNLFIENYNHSTKKILKRKNFKNLNAGIIISGSFPTYDEEGLLYQQNIINAISTLVETIHQSGLKVIFGAHPTYQGLILEKGKKESPQNYVEKTKTYVSKYFNYNKSYLDKSSTLIEIDKGEDIQESLTLMRTEMLSDIDAKALICIGGRKTSLGTENGVDEEVKLAIANGLDVFLISSCGGRTEQLFLNYKENFSKLNNLSVLENIKLGKSLDYRNTFKKIIKYLEGKYNGK